MWTRKKGRWLMMEEPPCRNSSIAKASCSRPRAGSLLAGPAESSGVTAGGRWQDVLHES